MKPVSVISGPVRLSGRRCQAISPQAMNDPPTERLTTATAVTSSSPRNRNTSAATLGGDPERPEHQQQPPSPTEGLVRIRLLERKPSLRPVAANCHWHGRRSAPAGEAGAEGWGQAVAG